MTPTRHIAWAFITASLFSTAACGSATARPDARPRAPRSTIELPTGGSIRDHIGGVELRSVSGTTGDAIRMLRPEFLRGRDQRSAGGSTSTPAIYVNGRYAGEVNVLELIPLTVVLDIYYMGAIAAKSMFGSHCPCDQGVVFVRTAR